MNTMNLLGQPKTETLTVAGNAANVLLADEMAWGAMRKVLGKDPEGAWRLKAVQHNYDPKIGGVGGVAFVAVFARIPDEYLPDES